VAVRAPVARRLALREDEVVAREDAEALEVREAGRRLLPST